MGRVACALVLGVGVLAGGCAQIFGFDETSPYSDNGIRISWHKKRVGATVVDEQMDLAAETATFLIVDAADPSGLRRVPAVQEDLDTWFGELPVGTEASILYTLPDDDIVRLFDFPARTIDAVYGILGHPDAEPAPPNAQIDVSATLDVPYAGEGLQLYAVGAWSYRSFPEVPTAGMTAWDPPAVPYNAASSWGSITGRPLERIRSSDAVMILRYLGAQLQGYLAVAPFDQQDGVDLVTGTMTTVALDRTLDATMMTTVAGPRLAATTPGVAGIGMSWNVNASPGGAISTSAGPALTSGALTEADTGVINLMYGNPFPWETTVTFSAAESRQYTPTGATSPTTLSAGLYSVVSPTPAMVFDLPQGLPLLVTIGGTALTTDGMTVNYDKTKAIEISFALDRQGACDVYGLTVSELVDNAMGAFIPTARVAMSGVAPRFTVPGDLLAGGKLYVIRATCQLGGIPNLATGDLVTRTWPVHVGYFDSAAFQVPL